MKNYSISYRIKYGQQQFIWAEQSRNMEHTSTKTFEIDYQLNAENQMINVILEFQPITYKSSKPQIKSEEHNGFLTESEANFIIINLQAYFDAHDSLMGNGEFRTPEHLNSKELIAAMKKEEIKDDSLDPPIMLSLKEIKPENLKKIRFKVKG